MSFDFSQFKGVHKVTKKPERVWVGMGWTMEIPNGFTYSVDPEKTGHGAMGTYLLRVQDTANWDDSESYSGYTADFNVVVYGRREITTCLCDDMSSTAFLESLNRLPTHILGEYQVFKRTKDILILYRIDNEDEDYTMYSFQVASRGSNLVYTGQFNCKIGDIGKRRNTIFQWLGTIGTLSEEERLSFQDYSGTIKSRIQPVFNNQSISIGQGITVEVPHGFHSETDPSQLGESRCLVIVPENYSFHDDPMEAPIALTVISPPSQKFPTNEALIDQYLNFFCRTGNAFRENAETFMFKHSGKSFSLSQLALFPDDAGALSRTALFVNEHVYIITIVINHSAADYDLTLSEWDIHRLTNAWVGRIHIEGEESRSSLPQATPSLELYLHYDQLGDTSKPKAKAVGSGGTAVFIANAGGTEFESYPVSRFDGELKAVAERAINKDSCSKEYRQLVSTATAYAALFRVNKDKFNPKEDRECDIRNLRMRRAYQLHVLRSFAWTLAEQASSQQKSLPDLVADDYQKIFTTIEKRDYLNYRADSHFPVLCGTADLHVFFVPDKTTKDDKKVLNESGEVFGNTIPNSIGSLEGLRKDLLALSEPMGKLFQHLLSNRDYSQPLTGTAADVLYAWCTMVLSAETPFYMEDGPMTCFYMQITEPRIPTLVETKTQSKKKPNGKIYTINGNTLHSYNGKAFTPEIPDDIQIIGTGAFNENSELGCTEIPERVTVIETGAFRNCPNLFRIIIPNIPIRIEKDAFINCPKLYIDTVPNSAAEKYCKENGIPCKTDALCAKLYTDSAKQKGKKKPKDTAIVGYSEYGFPLAEVEEGRKRLLDRKPKKTDGPNRFDLYLHTWNSSHGIALYYYDKIWPGYLKGRADLLQAADELVKLFRDDNLEYDVESELRQGLIRRGRTMHVLRSFVWTSVEYCKNTKEELADFSIEKSIQLAQFIFDRGGANYQPAGKTTKRIGAGLLTKSEKDHGYNEESYVALIRSLVAFLPIMKRIYDYFSEKQRAYSDAENTLKDVLAGWCAYALACFGEFHVEAGPEDYTPPKCRELPVDAGQLRVLNKHYYVDQANICVAYTGSGDTIDFPEGVQKVNIPEKYSDISGSKQYWNHSGTVIFPTTCSVCSNEYSSVNEHCSKSIKRLVIKGAVDTIASRYLPYKETVCLEQLEFLGTGNAVKSYAFSTEYPRLKKVVLPENLSTIGENAFYNTPMLKEIRIPPNVSKIGDGAFKQYDNNTKVLIVEKGSIAELVVQQFVAGKNYLSCRVVLSEAEQKRIEEENRLKRIAATLEQKLSALYRDLLDEGHRESLKLAVSSAITDTCDRQTWGEIRKRKIPAIPMANLSETHKKLESVAPEEAYDLLPEWIAEEYIHTAEEKRIQHLRAEEEQKARLAFETIIRELNGIANESALPLFENGIGKNEILKQFASRAKTVVGDGAIINSGLAKYIGNATLETLKLSLGRKPFDSAASLVDAVIEKKSSEIDRLTSLLEKKNSDLEAIEKEKALLEEERSHLGFFQGKRKKEIAALLEKIPERIKQVEDEYETAKSKV